MQRRTAKPGKPDKKKLDTLREIKIKSQVLSQEFASAYAPAEPPDPQLDERMMLQFTRSRLSVGSTHMQGNLLQQLRSGLNRLKKPAQSADADAGAGPQGLESERDFRLLAPSLQEHILSIIDANAEDETLVEQIRTLISDELFRGMNLTLQSAFVDTLIWNADAKLDYMLGFMTGKCFQTFLADPNYTEEQKSFELSFIADLSVLASANDESVLNHENFKNLNGVVLNGIIEELNAREGDRELDACYRVLVDSLDFLDMRMEYQQMAVSEFAQNPQADGEAFLDFLRSADFIKIYGNADAVKKRFQEIIAGE